MRFSTITRCRSLASVCVTTKYHRPIDWDSQRARRRPDRHTRASSRPIHPSIHPPPPRLPPGKSRLRSLVWGFPHARRQATRARCGDRFSRRRQTRKGEWERERAPAIAACSRRTHLSRVVRMAARESAAVRGRGRAAASVPSRRPRGHEASKDPEGPRRGERPPSSGGALLARGGRGRLWARGPPRRDLSRAKGGRRRKGRRGSARWTARPRARGRLAAGGSRSHRTEFARPRPRDATQHPIEEEALARLP